jgi:histidinol-phosphatase (PHP family)
MRTETTLHDEHMHLRPHGVSPLPAHRLAPMFDACKAKNVKPGLREHAPLPARYRIGPDEDYLFCMRVDEVEPFFDQLEGQGVPVGFEVDYLAGVEDETRAIVEDLLARARHRNIPIGGLTGSVHFLPGTVPDLDPSIDKRGVPHILCDYLEDVMRAHISDRGAAVTVREYFEAVRAMVRTGLYDVVGHLELVRKWDRADEHGKSLLFGDVEDVYSAELEMTLKVIAEHDMIVEYNTAGRDIVIGRPYLSDEALRACVRYGIKVALSSDAHTPKQVARYFDDAVSTLRAQGVRALYAARGSYVARERVAVSI